MDLVSALYDATESFPKRETYSLTDQMRRAAVSVQATSQRDKPTIVIASFAISFAVREDQLPDLKLR
jgi:hypothetical protein